MMLQIEHRDSRDVDIFLPDPQFLPFLDPSKHDFALDLQPTDCQSDGARFLKIAFEGIGEIDFIVASSLTSEPTTAKTIEGEAVLAGNGPGDHQQEDISSRRRRNDRVDIFDIAAGAETQAGLDRPRAATLQG